MKLPLLLLNLFLASAAFSNQDSSDVTPAPEPTGEQLIITPPSDWERIYQINTPQTRLSDFVPSGENAANWKTKLSIEAYDSQTLNIDPIELLLSEAKEDERKCNFVQHFNIFSGYENSYETSVRLFLCGENEFAQKGEVKLAKSIRGTDYIYSIRFTRRVAPFEPGQPAFTDEDMATWSDFLNDVILCDESKERPCQIPLVPEDSSQ